MFEKYLHSVRVGFELESEVDIDVVESLGLEINNYHSLKKQKLGKYPIRVETDSSIVCRRNNMAGAEFITYPRTLRDALWYLGKQLQALTGCTDTEDFTDTLNFNSTTGAHIHISAKKLNLKEMIMNENFLKYFDKNLKVALKDYPIVLEQFYRSYARKFIYRNLWKERHNWLNYNSRWNTVEIRGANLVGIKTIKDIKIVYESIIKCFFKSIDQHLKVVSEEIAVTIIREPVFVQEEDITIQSLATVLLEQNEDIIV